MHVFLVHSSITFIITREIIRAKNIKKEDVVLLADRNFDVQKYCDNYRVVNFRYNWQSNPFIKSFNPLYILRTLRSFDKHIFDITKGQNYFVYLPHTHNTIYQVLTTHPKCEGFFYIEEGTLSFLTKEELPDTLRAVSTSFLMRLIYLFRIKSRQEAFHGDYRGAYYITPGAFPEFEKKEQLELYIENSNQFETFNDAHIVVFDPASKYNLTTSQAYLHGIHSLFEYFVRNNKPVVYFKLHPEHLKKGDEDALVYKRMMRDFSEQSDIKFLELSQDVSLEELAIFAKNVTFYINVSSVGIYAKRYNQRVITFANKISEADNGFKKTTERLSRWMEFYENLN